MTMTYENKNGLSGTTTFRKAPRNKEHPYTMVSNSLIRDQTISPNCRWMLIYLLSQREDWKINFKQILNHVSSFFKRDSLYNVINEAIDSGYMERVPIKKGNLNQGFQYYVHEEKLKKCFRHPVPPDTGKPDHKKDCSNISNNLSSINKKKHMSEPPSEVGRLTIYFYEQIKKLNPKILEPNLQKWEGIIDKMLRVDKRTEKEVRDVIDYIVWQHQNPKGDFRWSMAVQSPEKLRKHFAAMWLEVTSKKEPKKNFQHNINYHVMYSTLADQFVKKYFKIANAKKIRLNDFSDYLEIGNDRLYYTNPKFEELLSHYEYKYFGQKPPEKKEE